MKHLKRFSFTGATAVLMGILALALPWGSAQAANGDNLSTIVADRTGTACASIDAAGNHGSVGVGIAFNGTNLLISCYNDSTVTEINPADGSKVAVHTIAGASSLGALAWDATNNQLWGCSAFTQVGIVDLAANSFTPVFDASAVVFPNGAGSGCFDGLAYDGIDDTLWASNDVSSTTEHYSISGAPISKFSNGGLIGACGNSGIAVGQSAVYLANNGCSQIHTVQKDFSASVLFAGFPRRLEDLECDPLTFASQGKGAIWSIDAYDNILNAWEIPATECPFGGGGNVIRRMTGGGSVFAAGGVRVTHGFELHCDTGDQPNRLEINWGKGNRFHLTSLDTAACSDDPAIDPGHPIAGFDTYVGKGTGRCNGVDGATVQLTFKDAGEPGKNDTARIVVSGCPGGGGVTVSGPLKNGNHQAHGE